MQRIIAEIYFPPKCKKHQEGICRNLDGSRIVSLMVKILVKSHTPAGGLLGHQICRPPMFNRTRHDLVTRMALCKSLCTCSCTHISSVPPKPELPESESLFSSSVAIRAFLD